MCPKIHISLLGQHLEVIQQLVVVVVLEEVTAAAHQSQIGLIISSWLSLSRSHLFLVEPEEVSSLPG